MGLWEEILWWSVHQNWQLLVQKQQKYPMKGSWQRNKDVDSLDEEKLGAVRKRKLEDKVVSALDKIWCTTFTFPTSDDMSNVCAVQQTSPAEQSGNLSLSRTKFQK